MDVNLIPEDWRRHLQAELEDPSFAKLAEFVDQERQRATIYPPAEDVFNAFRATSYDDVKVLLLGQDPYHGPNQAHGLCFSVQPGTKFPPSLANMFKELQSDLGLPKPKNGCLTPWAKQGVLLINAVMTVRAGEANSHKAKGWEKFTDGVIREVSAKTKPVVFVLWGGYAQKKEPLIDASRHIVIKSAHPSPLSANAGFFGSKPYSKINAALAAHGESPIDWSLE